MRHEESYLKMESNDTKGPQFKALNLLHNVNVTQKPIFSWNSFMCFFPIFRKVVMTNIVIVKFLQTFLDIQEKVLELVLIFMEQY